MQVMINVTMKYSGQIFFQITSMLRSGAVIFTAAGILLICLNVSCSQPTNPPVNETIPEYSYHIMAEYPHLQDAFTQGLVFHDSVLYEGTGLYGRSSLRKVKLETGEVLQIRNLPGQYFGEGITILNNKIIQLTWLSNIGFVYDLHTFALLDSFHYSSQGWGITHNGQYLIMSDGSSTLRFLDTLDFHTTGELKVMAGSDSVNRLNELEFIDGEIYANIWQTNKIARISTATGKVTGWVYLDQLLDPSACPQTIDVLNGIAYDALNQRLFVTGKWWCKLFEIQLVQR